MDKTGIIVVSLCVLLIGWWFVEQNKIANQQKAYNAANPPAPAQAAGSNAAPATTAGAPVTTTATAAAVLLNTNLDEQTLVLTNGRARYTFTSLGGGLKQVDLLDYKESISQRWKKTKTATDNAVASLNTRATPPILTISGDVRMVGDGVFQLSAISGGVRAEKNFSDGLRLVKEFRFASNHLLNATVRMENTTGKTLDIPAQEIIVGTATPMDADDSAALHGMMWSDGVKSENQAVSYFQGGGCFGSSAAPKAEYRNGANNVVWLAAHNQFFTILAMLKTNEPAHQIVARPVVLPQFPNVQHALNAPLPQGVETAFVYPKISITANTSVERQITLYVGPKEYRTLADIGLKYENRADLVMNYGGFMGFFAKPLLLTMNWLHDITTLGYGIVIVLITIIIKLLFWPLTAASTRSMKRMQALAPELTALKEKYKDDAQKMTSKQWELYKKHKVNPMSGCLPMLIQMPVFIGFFTMIQSAIELRGAPFLWVTDLSKPDTLFMIPGVTFIPFISTPEGLPFNLLPLLMGASMFWQSMLTPPSPGMDPTQQKILRYMPLMFLVFLYNYSSGLALYWTVNNVLTAIQTKLTKTNVPAPVTTALTPEPKKKK